VSFALLQVFFFFFRSEWQSLLIEELFGLEHFAMSFWLQEKFVERQRIYSPRDRQLNRWSALLFLIIELTFFYSVVSEEVLNDFSVTGRILQAAGRRQKEHQQLIAPVLTSNICPVPIDVLCS